MKLSNLERGEMIAAVAGVALAISVFLDWYGTAKDNPNSKVTVGGELKPAVDASAWQAHSIMRFLWLAAAASPLILVWIIVRGHELSWPRGELTAIVAITAFVLVLVAGFIVRPGEPRDTISLELGWFAALAATIGMMVGAVQRSSESGRARKPPGMP